MCIFADRKYSKIEKKQKFEVNIRRYALISQASKGSVSRNMKKSRF